MANPAEAAGSGSSVELISADEFQIRNLIHTVRGQQVMLDSDLARLYGVETKVLNRAAKRNEDRFPEDFLFRIESNEINELRCQFGTLAGKQVRNEVGRTYRPYVYTEQGVAMLSAVLRSKVAIEVSVRIIRAFVEMRHFLASNSAMFDRIRDIELRQLEDHHSLTEYQKSTDERFERVFDYMEAHEAPKQRVFFEGQIYDAFELLVSLVQRAKREIVLMDGYVDTATLNILAKKADGVEVTIWTHTHSRLTQQDIDAFNAQYPLLTVKHDDSFHDRMLILDGAEFYFVGASLKDAGKKSFAIVRIEDGAAAQAILARVDEHS